MIYEYRTQNKFHININIGIFIKFIVAPSTIQKLKLTKFIIKSNLDIIMLIRVKKLALSNGLDLSTQSPPPS